MWLLQSSIWVTLETHSWCISWDVYSFLQKNVTLPSPQHASQDIKIHLQMHFPGIMHRVLSSHPQANSSQDMIEMILIESQTGHPTIGCSGFILLLHFTSTIYNAIIQVTKKRYLQICANCDNYPLPSSEDKLCSFVAYLAVSSLMNWTIKCYFSAVHHLQIVMNMGDAQISSMSILEHVLWWGINKEQSKKTTPNKPHNPKHSHSIERGMGRSSPQLWSHYVMGSMLHLFFGVIEICGTVCSLRWGIWPLHTSQFLRNYSRFPWQDISHNTEDKGFKNRSLYTRSHNLLRGNRHETLSSKSLLAYIATRD